MTILVAIEGRESDEWAQRLRELAPGRKILVRDDATDPAGVEYLFAWKAPHGLAASLPELKATFSLGAGVDHILADPNLPDVPIVRIVDPSLTMRMTEWVAQQVLSHHRLARAYREQQGAHIWKTLAQPMAADVGVGIMGLGVLGRDAAEKLAALGFDVAGWSRTPREAPGIACFHGHEGLDAFLARTDILVCLLPLTPETEGLIDYSLIAKLRRDNHMGGAAVINAGRGREQVEGDIVRALDEGILSGASLDVFETEPLPGASPLWSHPRVVVTPHVAAESDPNFLCAYILRQIEAFEAGRPLENVVDRERGY